MPIVTVEMLSRGSQIQTLTYAPARDMIVEAVELQNPDNPCFAMILLASKGSILKGVLLQEGPTILPHGPATPTVNGGRLSWAGELHLTEAQEIRGVILHSDTDDRLALTVQVTK